MIKDIKELNFPAYATLQQATVTINDMGSRSISTLVQISGEIVPDFSYDWEVEFKGERYIHPVRKPQGTKENTSMSAKIDMVFQHWAIYEMKRQYFVEMASTSAGTAVADKYIASLELNLVDFVTAFNLVLNHYFGGRIIIKLNPEWQSDPEAKFVSISYSYIWDVLQQVYDIYGVRWTIKTNAEGVCEILMGYPAEEASHIFEYGFEGGLLSVQRQVQNTEIRNRLLGRGGEKNLPLRYFKDEDPKNPLFKADPDWVPELANVAFTELRGKSFRDYVRGWKARHYDGNAMEEPTEAYLAGYNAEKFDPIEYVEDKDSIAKYGVLVGALQNNEDIYPSIQGAPNDVDAIVDAEQVTDDDVDSAVENNSVTTNLESGHQTYRNAPANSTVTIETLTKRYFSVPEGKVGNLSMSLTATGKYSDLGDYEETHPILKSDTVKVTIHDKTTGAEVKSSSVPVVNIPAGDYYYMISADVETNYDRTSMVTLNIESVYLYTSTPNKSEGWKQTFDIWVRNIWGSTRSDGETDQQYADRVWAPILGDRMGGDARVVFTSGWLSFSSDWEFPIVGYAYDDSKEGSHWRLTLAKSEAELEASGKYIPYEGYNASAGDRFFFIGIDMPYEYVIWAEERLDDFKRDSLMQTAEVNPAWVIKTDKVRLNQDREGAVLVDSLNAGSQIRLASKQFISGAYETLYVQSLTYKWTADTIMYPDVEVVVSDKAVVVKNPVAQIQSNIEAIQRQVGSMSNLQQIIRQICDKLYLRKDGISDVSKSPTKFLGKVTGENFRQGQIGGRDWGIYRDENGNAILEADKLVARQGILVTDLVVNEATYVGGLQIRSAAHMDVTSVEDNEAGYVCSFDQKQGSVTNKFTEDDVVLCQKFDADQSEVKFYKRRVVSVSETSVTLSKTDVNGTGVPAEGDVIIHYGNYTDKSRQFVIIGDVIGGGYERMLMGLDSVASDGVEYYFAGKSADSKARWFVGGAEQYAEYKDGQLTIKGNIFVTGSDQNINEQIAQLDFIRNAFGENAQGLILGTAIVVGYNDDEGKFVPMAGLSGVYDKEADNGGPAAWYGGTPEDAKSVIFMDGTGYFADGLFKWDKDKGINLGNDAIKINYDGSVDFGDQIRIGASGDETLGSLLTIVAKLSEMWILDKNGNLVTERQVVIKNNLIVEGDTASGGDGGGGSSSVGIQGIVVNGTTYRDTDGDGLIDLGTIGGGTLTEITYEMIVEALGYTPANSALLGSLASKNSLAWSEVTGKVTSAGVFSFIDSTFALSALWFNYRTLQNTNLTTPIGSYHMGNGAIGYAGVVASKFTVNGGTSSQFLKADGSLDNTSYLSTAGGTLDGDLKINSTDGTPALIYFSVASSRRGALGCISAGPVYYDANNNGYDLYHTGNFNPANYLPKTGGILDGSLQIGKDDNTASMPLFLKRSGTTAQLANINDSAGLLFTKGQDIGFLRVYPYKVTFNDYDILTSAGGTVSGGLTIGDASNTSWLPISFNRNGIQGFIGSAGSVMEMGTNDGYLRVGGNVLTYMTSAGGNVLVHSGNIGDYNAGGLVPNTFTDTNNAYIGGALSWANWGNTTNNPNNVTYAHGFVFGYGGSAIQIGKNAFDVNTLYVRMSDYTGAQSPDWSDWKTIAFTDSNVASATKLATARTIWGQSFDGTGNITGTLNNVKSILFESDNTYDVGTNTKSARYIYATWIGAKIGKSFMLGANDGTHMRINTSGNVTIGSSDLAGGDSRLYVDGTLSIPQEKGIYMVNASGTLLRSMYLASNGNLNVGRGVAANGGSLVLDGASIYMRYGTGGATGLFLNSSGDVGIGTTSPAYKLDVNGYARANAVVSNVVIDINRNPSNGAVLNSNLMGLEVEAYASRVQFKAYTTSGTSLTGITINSDDYIGIGTTNPSFKLHVNGTAKINDITRLGANLYVSQDATAYGLQLWGDADGGYLGVHSKGSFKSTNMRFGYDGSATVYGNLVVQGDISA